MFVAQDDDAEFQAEARGVSRTFQDIRDEVVRQYGYDTFRPQHAVTAGDSTQEQFTSRTMMQCDGETDLRHQTHGDTSNLCVCVCVCVFSGVVEHGVQRCADWFSSRWAECMEAVPVPVVNHVLCVSMKFSFLCDVMRGERSHVGSVDL